MFAEGFFTDAFWVDLFWPADEDGDGSDDPAVGASDNNVGLRVRSISRRRRVS